MKEERYFYTPDILTTQQLPEDEAQHAVRVLRMREGDELWCMDGCGTFYRGTIAVATNHQCLVHISESIPQPRAWRNRLTLAFAPTKNMDRTEWLVEKAVEIGVDRLVLLDCKNSERRVVKPERLEKIIVSAMKQSRKAWKTELLGLTSFANFLPQTCGKRFIAHCYDMKDVGNGTKTFLLDALKAADNASLSDKAEDITVMVGPEGDFSIDEVTQATAHGFVSVSLGNSRLRTETAGLVAVHLMQIAAAL